MHIIHDWCLHYMTASYRCYKVGCYARITYDQLFSRSDNLLGGDIPTHCDELWNIYKSHGLNGYRLVNKNPEEVDPIKWKVEAY